MKHLQRKTGDLVCAFRYKSSSSPAFDPVTSTRSTAIGRLGAAIIRRILARIEIGRLTLELPNGQTLTGGQDLSHATSAHHATLVMHRWRMLLSLLRQGDIGFAESYLRGDWSSPDIAALVDLAARNRQALNTTISGTAWTRLINRMAHHRRRNTRAGSRRNIIAHYDLGNAFYRRWLDDSVQYSSALFDAPNDTLEQAQARKLDAIVALLQIKGGERILEIGCGWGALALKLAQLGCHVTGLTLSPAQREMALARAEAAGLEDHIDIRLQDYRDVDGSFDRIVSIEMFEAVGQTYWPTYFDTIAQRLMPTGIAVLQVISIEEQRFEAYRSGVDFIQRYIFPGGMLPTTTMLGTLAQSAGLRCDTARRFGSCYAMTLAEWHRRFQAEWPVLQTMGFDARFKRLWEYYLKYCEGGFTAGAIDVGLYRLQPAALNQPL